MLFKYVRITVYVLVTVLVLSLLVVGTVGIIAELKGTWHWAIHLQSTVRYVGTFFGYLLALLVPLLLVLLVGRLVVSNG